MSSQAHSRGPVHDHDHTSDHHDHGDGAEEAGRDHVHGMIDPLIASTTRGMWAVKWSFAVLAVAALLQIAVVLRSGSVALLADAIHNVGDSVTAIPLAVAFLFARRRPSARFTYGYGRIEDLAGVVIVMIIFASALVAAYEGIAHLIHPRSISALGAVAAAGLIGFAANEIAAVLRIRVGREINSAALIADGHHARVDGLTSLAVAAGAAGVRMGFPLADPLIGLAIAVAIFAIVREASKAVFTRLLDGVEPGVVEELRRAAERLPEIQAVSHVRARWMGHRMLAEAEIRVDDESSVAAGESIAARFREAALRQVPALAEIAVAVRPFTHGSEDRSPTSPE
jgi:cation diffusion facilitator family transporter